MSEQMDATKDIRVNQNPQIPFNLWQNLWENREPFKKPTWFWGWAIQTLLITSFKIL